MNHFLVEHGLLWERKQVSEQWYVSERECLRLQAFLRDTMIRSSHGSRIFERYPARTDRGICVENAVCIRYMQ